MTAPAYGPTRAMAMNQEILNGDAVPPAIKSIGEAHRALNDATILRHDAELYPHLHHATPEATLSYADDLEGAAIAFLYPDEDTERGSRALVSHSQTNDTPARRPTRAAAIADKERLALASEARSDELAIDMAESLEAANSAESALAHQMAAAHALALRMVGRANLEIEGMGRFDWEKRREAMVEIARLSNAAARLMATYQQALFVLAKVRGAGKQTLIVQHVQVSDGGQAVIAGQAGDRATGEPP
jgi:hypothetical protein